MKKILKRVLLAAVIVVAIPIGVLIATEGADDWDENGREENGRLLFDKHVENHPFHYTRAEQKELWSKIDLASMVTDPWHLVELPHVTLGFRYFNESKIGEQAQDFDLPEVGGGRIRLSDYRGKIAAYMFSANT